MIELVAGPLIGGILIGLAASALLLLNGRVFGISGILGGALAPKSNDTAWRFAALLGLLAAGGVLTITYPKSLEIVANGSLWRYVIAGLLVGYGTQLGSGCTSGHGVCGMSRLSPRSITATLAFILAGMLTVGIARFLGGDA